MANNSFQRVMALVQNDIKKSRFYVLFGMYAVMQLFATIGYKDLWYRDIPTDELSKKFLSMLYGTINLPTTGAYHAGLLGVMFFIAYRKFTHKNESMTYRLLPATNWEKCLNIICDYIVLVLGFLAVKAVFCIVFGLMMHDMSIGLNALKGIFVGHAPSSGLYHQLNYCFDLENMKYGTRLWGMSRFGIPFEEMPHLYNEEPLVLNGVLSSVTSTGNIGSYFFIQDWTEYPAFAFGLNTVHFLFCMFFDFLVITAFAIRKQGQKFLNTKENNILCIILACNLIMVVCEWISHGNIISTTLGNLMDCIVEIFVANGPWCWASMNGWMVQAGFLLIYLALTFTYLYKKVKSL